MSDSPKDGGGQTSKIQTVSLDDATVNALAHSVPTKTPKPRRTKNEWRSLFAFILLAGFLLIIAFIVFADQVWGARSSAKDLLTMVGTLISSPLSFVIGYYYNKDKNGNQ